MSASSKYQVAKKIPDDGLFDDYDADEGLNFDNRRVDAAISFGCNQESKSWKSEDISDCELSDCDERANIDSMYSFRTNAKRTYFHKE